MKNFGSTIIKTVAVIFTIIMVAAILFGAGLLGYNIRGWITPVAETVVSSAQDDNDLKFPGEVEKTNVTVDEVKAKVQEIGGLNTCECTYTVTRGRDFTRYPFEGIRILGMTNHVELTCTGVVKAGYNIEDIAVKVNNATQTIYVTLPEPNINSNQLMWDSSMECYERNNIMNPIDFEEYQTLVAEILEEGLQQAEENGLYDTVEENAKNLITNFLGCFEGYGVVFL